MAKTRTATSMAKTLLKSGRSKEGARISFRPIAPLGVEGVPARLEIEPHGAAETKLALALGCRKMPDGTIVCGPGAVTSLMALAAGSLGECRRARPFSGLRPALDAKGTLKWCCNHDPEHCA